MTVPPPVHTDTMTDEEEPSVLISAKALGIILAEVTCTGTRADDLDEAIEEAESALERYPVIPHVPTKEQA